MTGFTPETEACLACHPSQKDVEPMTDKAVDEAVERVRAWLDGISASSDGVVIDRCYDPAGILDLTLGDLRALLSALELGSVASLPVKAVDEPATPLSAELLASVSVGELADWAQAAFEGALPDDATPYDVGRAFASVGEHLHAVLAERLEEISAARTTPCPADCDCTADCAALSAPTADSGRLDAEAGGWRKIESAPLDTHIWVFSEGLKWQGVGGRALAYLHSNYNGHDRIITLDGRCGPPLRQTDPKYPTHWHPLPALGEPQPKDTK